MDDKAPQAQPDLGPVLRVATLAARKPTRFDLRPEAGALALLADLLGITQVRELHFKGELRPQGRHDWMLEAELSAEVEQPCSVTLAPVVTRIRETVRRRFLADLPQPQGEEAEIPEDDTLEPLGETISPGAVAAEVLALALPLYPRAPGAALGEAVFAAPGVAPLRDEDLRPFAGLAGLAQKLGTGQKDDG
ncbi:MAG: DUF177 domain-containing protein [Gemmobacter sp.]|nr:DUF177 domain-containing protein [Gemmobacter sp.]